MSTLKRGETIRLATFFSGGFGTPESAFKYENIDFENVANFAHQFSDVMNRVIGELEEIGYQTSWHIMSADDYGTPQTRKRVFIVGFLGG